MPYCSKCGHNIPSNVRFCTACGAPVNGSGQNNLNNQTAQTTLNPPLPSSPPSPPAPPAPSAAPPPPPTPGSQPGSYRVQMMRYKEASQPPQYSTVPPTSYVQQQQAQRKQSAQRRSGSSFGGCFRRGFHFFTAAVAMIATLSWGIRSAFPNLNLGNFGEIFNVFSSCTGGKGEGGGLLGGSDSGNSFEGTLLGKEGYERAIDDAATLEILTEMGVADKMTGVDHTLAFGTYQIAYCAEDMQGHTVAFRFDPPTSDDKRVLADFTMLGDGREVQKGVVGYGGSTLFIIYEDLEDVGRKRKPDLVVCANADGKSFSVYDKGKEMMKMELEK